MKIRIECSDGEGPRFHEELLADTQDPQAWAAALIERFNAEELEIVGEGYTPRILHSVEVVDADVGPHDWVEVSNRQDRYGWYPAVCDRCGAKGRYSRRGDKGQPKNGDQECRG